MPYGGFWRRAAAYGIDLLLLALLDAVVLLLAAEHGLLQYPVLAGAYFFALAWVYFAGMESSQEQATIGKRALGLKVCDEHGRRIGFGRASLRYFSKVLSALILYAGFVMAAFSARRQALHDRLAGTLVLKERRALYLAPAPARGPCDPAPVPDSERRTRANGAAEPPAPGLPGVPAPLARPASGVRDPARVRESAHAAE